MPEKIYRRLWCKPCQDWKLFDSDMKCPICETAHEKTLLGEIPKEKIQEQRDRYAEKRRRDFSRVINFGAMLGLGGGFTPGITEDMIVESDAGQVAIDKARSEEINRRRQEKLDLIAKHKGTGRNEKCRCGSGKKHKLCCWSKVN